MANRASASLTTTSASAALSCAREASSWASSSGVSIIARYLILFHPVADIGKPLRDVSADPAVDLGLIPALGPSRQSQRLAGRRQGHSDGFNRRRLLDLGGGGGGKLGLILRLDGIHIEIRPAKADRQKERGGCEPAAGPLRKGTWNRSVRMRLGYPFGDIVKSVEGLLAFSAFGRIRLGQRLPSIFFLSSARAAKAGTWSARRAGLQRLRTTIRQ